MNEDYQKYSSLAPFNRLLLHAFTRKTIFVALLGTSLSIASTAQAREPILYKGVRWDTTPKQLKHKYPSFYCKNYDPREVLCISTSETYFNRRASNVFVAFLDNKLQKIEITLNFDKDNSIEIAPELRAKMFFIELKEELTKKYGKADDPNEWIKNTNLEALTSTWSQDVASIGMIISSNKKSNNGGFTVEVAVTKSGYDKLQEEINRYKKSKDL